MSLVWGSKQTIQNFSVLYHKIFFGELQFQFRFAFTENAKTVQEFPYTLHPALLLLTLCNNVLHLLPLMLLILTKVHTLFRFPWFLPGPFLFREPTQETLCIQSLICTLVVLLSTSRVQCRMLCVPVCASVLNQLLLLRVSIDHPSKAFIASYWDSIVTSLPEFSCIVTLSEQTRGNTSTEIIKKQPETAAAHDRVSAIFMHVAFQHYFANLFIYFFILHTFLITLVPQTISRAQLSG